MDRKYNPEITCQKCHAVQQYTGQENCVSCKVRLNNWSVASQLKLQTFRRNNDHESDGA